MTMKIKTTGRNTQTIKALVYAPSGYGKTSLAGTLEGKTLIISAESGLLSLASKKIDYVEIEGATAKDKVASLVSIYKEILTGVEYDNIFVDSLTEFSQLFVEFQNGLFPERKDGIVMWGEVAKQMRSFVKKFRDLDKYNVIFTCLEKTDKDELGRRFKVPDVAGKISEQLPQYFDEVFTIRILEESKRMIQTDGRENYLCKDRSGRLSSFEPMDLKIIFGKINAE